MIKPILLIACGALFCAPGSAQGVRIVEPLGNKAFSNLQDAVLAAREGDVLLVASGTYPGFTVNGKGLSIIARTGDSVRITSKVTVRNLPATSDFWLVGVDIQRFPCRALSS
jgi:hypothetical protein